MAGSSGFILVGCPRRFLLESQQLWTLKKTKLSALKNDLSLYHVYVYLFKYKTLYVCANWQVGLCCYLLPKTTSSQFASDAEKPEVFDQLNTADVSFFLLVILAFDVTCKDNLYAFKKRGRELFLKEVGSRERERRACIHVRSRPATAWPQKLLTFPENRSTNLSQILYWA